MRLSFSSPSRIPAKHHGARDKKKEVAEPEPERVALRPAQLAAELVAEPQEEQLAVQVRTPVNNIEYLPPNFEGLVLGCIDVDFCK